MRPVESGAAERSPETGSPRGRVTFVVSGIVGTPTRSDASDDYLAGLGFESVHTDDAGFAVPSEGVVWMSGSPNWYPRTFARLLAVPSERRPPVLFWLTEPLALPRAANLRPERRHLRELVKVLVRDRRRHDPASNFHALEELRRFGLPDLLVVSTHERKEFLAERGIASEFAPLGYRPEQGRDLGLERDIDVLFLGDLRVPRRKKLFRRLRRAGVPLQAVGGWGDAAYYGENRVRLLNRTKILLNFARHPGLLSGERMLLGMANKALVAAEPIYDPRPYVPDVHFVAAELDDLPATIEHYLADAEARRRITETAYEFVTGDLRYERSLDAILGFVGDDLRDRAGWR